MASFWLEFEQAGEVRQANFESESVTIGRDRSCDFVLDHPTVSRQHALLVHQGGGQFHLVVLSRGGLTAVDGTPAQSQEVPIFDGTMLTMGQYSLRFRSQLAQPRPGGPFPFGGFSQGAPATANQGSAPGGAAPEKAPVEESEDKGPGIVTWDEIAASSAAQEEREEVGASDFERIQAAKSDDESNPVLIFGGLLGAVVLVLVAVFSGGGETTEVVQEQIPFEEQTPVEISVSCIDDPDCRRKAEDAYAQATALLERRDVETGNLFDAYKRLLEAEAYIEKTSNGQMPEKLSELEEKRAEARNDLDTMFRRWRMEYHNASTLNRHEEMADILVMIDAYFPDRTAREARWARDREIEMKNSGIYPIGRR